jgi:hypothetical protein
MSDLLVNEELNFEYDFDVFVIIILFVLIITPQSFYSHSDVFLSGLIKEDHK